MTCLTRDPSVANYNICRHDKSLAQTKMAEARSSSTSGAALLLPAVHSPHPPHGGPEVLGEDGLGLGFKEKGGKGGMQLKEGGRPCDTDRHVDSKHKHGKTNGSRLPL